MVLIKEDFADLRIFELLQNVWCFNVELKNKECVWKQDYQQYLGWCEEDLFAKWHHELSSLSFILKKIKEQKSLFYPGLGLTANCEKYMEFLSGVKNVDASLVFKKDQRFC